MLSMVGRSRTLPNNACMQKRNVFIDLFCVKLTQFIRLISKRNKFSRNVKKESVPDQEVEIINKYVF